MTLSYTLFLALLLLAPGIGTWAGVQFGAKRGLVTPAPERPGSTTTLTVIVFGALIGHFILAVCYVLQSLVCESSGQCWVVSFDPNIYRAIISGTKGGDGLVDFAYAWWLLALILPSVLMVILMACLIRTKAFVRLFEPATFGWLLPLIEKSREPNHTIVADVVTTRSSDGCNVGYLGNVEQLAFDENKAVAMLTLRQCDMFLTCNTNANIVRIPVEGPPIPLLHLQGKDILNISFQVIEVPA